MFIYPEAEGRGVYEHSRVYISHVPHIPIVYLFCNILYYIYHIPHIYIYAFYRDRGKTMADRGLGPKREGGIFCYYYICLSHIVQSPSL